MSRYTFNFGPLPFGECDATKPDARHQVRGSKIKHDRLHLLKTFELSAFDTAIPTDATKHLTNQPQKDRSLVNNSSMFGCQSSLNDTPNPNTVQRDTGGNSNHQASELRTQNNAYLNTFEESIEIPKDKLPEVRSVDFDLVTSLDDFTGPCYQHSRGTCSSPFSMLDDIFEHQDTFTAYREGLAVCEPDEGDNARCHRHSGRDKHEQEVQGAKRLLSPQTSSVPASTRTSDTRYSNTILSSSGPTSVSSQQEEQNETDVFRICAQCEAQFAQSQALEIHAREEHHKSYACHVAGCQKLYSTRSALARHRNSHHTKVVHVCPYCQKSFIRKDHLQEHTRQHSIILPFVADGSCVPLVEEQVTAKKRPHTTESVSPQDGKRRSVLTVEPAKGSELRVLYEPVHGMPTLDIVAVSGLCEATDSSREGPEGKFFWMRDDLKNLLPDARILMFDYDAKVFTEPTAKAETHRSFTFANDMLEGLRSRRCRKGLLKITCPIIFVGHSLGGFVVKAALRRAHERPIENQDILDSTKAILFLGTPHQGMSPLTDWSLEMALKDIGIAVGVKNQKLLHKLQSWAVPLSDLCDDFSQFASQYYIATFHEQLGPERDSVVPGSLAIIGSAHERVVGIKSDHVSMSKGVTAWSKIRKSLSECVQRCLSNRKPSTRKLPIQDTGPTMDLLAWNGQHYDSLGSTSFSRSPPLSAHKLSTNKPLVQQRYAGPMPCQYNSAITAYTGVPMHHVSDHRLAHAGAQFDMGLQPDTSLQCYDDTLIWDEEVFNDFLRSGYPAEYQPSSTSIPVIDLT